MAIHRNGVISHVGLVLGHGHTSWNDSMHIESFHAMVWNPDTLKPQDVYYKDDYTNTDGHFEVDATPEVLAAYEAYTTKITAGHIAYVAKLEFERLERGKVISVNRGRKVAKGTIGMVFWLGNNGYGESVGIIALDGTKHFTASANVDVITPSTEQLATLEKLQADSKAQWLATNPRPAKHSHHYVRGQYRRG